MPLIPELRRWTQEDQKFRLILKLKANLGYMRPYPQKKETMHLFLQRSGHQLAN